MSAHRPCTDRAGRRTTDGAGGARGSSWAWGRTPGRPCPTGCRWRESTERFANRELSWLEFANRLLDLADDERQPLLERVKFLAIFTEGLDEFFQVRVAGLEDQVAAGLRTRSPDGLGPGEQLAAIAARVTTLVARQNRIFADGVEPLLRRRRDPDRRLAHAGRRRPRAPRRGLHADHLPGPHPAGRRPGAPVPLHLQPQPQPGPARRRPGDRRAADRPGQGPAAAAPVRGPARRQPLRARRAGDRRPPRHPLPGDVDRRAPRLPGDPQRRPVGGRGRRPGPAGRRRARAAPAPLRPGRPPGGGLGHLHRPPRHARVRGRRPRGQRLPVRRARSTSAACATWPPWTAPTWRRSRGCRWHRRRWPATATCSRCSPRATSCSTTPTSRSPPPSRRSSSGRRPTRTCWPSARPSTAPAPTARSWPPSSGPRSRASR